MKKSFSFVFGAFCVLLGISVVSFAQEASTEDKPRTINERQQNQQNRIFEGVKDDELNRREYYRLQKEQNQIRKEERAYRSDGEFTKDERVEIRQELNQSSRHIYKAKNNDPKSINERQLNQQNRIFNGVKDDELNRKEYARLQREQNQIRREEQRYRNSGDKFTRKERADVRRDLNKSSRHIYKAKRN